MFYLLHFWCSTLHSMKLAQHCLYNSGKGRCTRYMWSNIFVLWNRISAIFYEDRKYCLHTFQNSMLLFINWLIFDIMNFQNNQSLEFEWIPVLAPLRSVNDQGFSWLHNVFLKSLMFSFSSNAKETLQKMLVRKCSSCGKNMKDWK